MTDAPQLKSLVERIEALEEDKASITEDIKEVYTEAKSHGYDTKVLRRVVALRKMEKAEREEQDELTQLYLSQVEEG